MHNLFAALILAFFSSIASAEQATITVYTGFGTSNGFLVQGRVMEKRDATATSKSDSWYTNLWRNLRRFGNDEIDGLELNIAIDSQTWVATTDAEGYYDLDVANVQLPTGWRKVSARSKKEAASTEGDLLIVPDTNTLGVISDIDDTLLVSEVNQKSALIANTFLKNSQQRLPVVGAARAIGKIVAQNPLPQASAIIYLSASPRQLYGNIAEYLNYQQFPTGVLIAKRVTDDRSSEPLFDQFAYKVAKIEDIFRRLPKVKFTLLGDDGEKDPEIYHDVIQRFPNHVTAVYIRKVNPDQSRTTFPEQHDFAILLSE